MIHDQTQVKSHDGFGLYFQRWASERPVRGVLALLRGQSDHSGRYDWLGQELAEAGYELHMVDLRRHGHSAGRRGHVWSIQGYLNDVMTLVAHSNDPLVHGRITPRAYVAISRVQSYYLEHARELRPPLLLMHGGADRIAALSGTWDFYDAAPAGDKTLKHHNGMYHEIFNEPGRVDVIKNLIAWLADH